MNRFDGDVSVQGRLIAGSFVAPANSVNNTAIAALSAVDADKLQHRYTQIYAQEHDSDAAVGRKVVHVVRGNTGTVDGFSVGVTTAAGAATTVVVDLLKNGTTILSSTVSVTNSLSANVLLPAGGFTSPDLVQGDVLEVKVTSVTGTNEPKGLFAVLEVTESITS